MKLEKQLDNIERSGVVDKIKCGMELNAASFQMLARQYSNPIKAILQELSANAADSHSRANKSDVPFTVKLPTKLDAHLRIRDYGVSMSEEVIRNVYANYMKSDKTHTNDETGYFGIGSKTPLAYTDSFNITTYLDGTMRMYTLCYNEDGIPELNVYGEYETEEPNGVEISFAVKDDDISKFEEEAEHVFSFFETPPIVNGSDAFALKTYERILEGDGWYFTGRTGLWDNTKSYVVMGNIAYPLVGHHFSSGSSVNTIIRNGSHFTIPMGSISMTPSREQLEYSDRTIAAIEARCEEIKQEAASKVIEELDECDSAWSASCLKRKFANKFHTADWDFSKSKWGDQIVDYFDLTDLGCVFRFAYSIHSNSYHAGKVKRSSIPVRSMYCLASHVIVIQDTEKGFDKNSRHYVKSQEGDDTTVYLLKGVTKQAVLDALGAVESDGAVLLASELPQAPKVERGPRAAAKQTRKVKLFMPRGDSSTQSRAYDSRFWDSDHEVHHKTDTHVYVMLDRYSIAGDLRHDDMRHLWVAMKSLDIAPDAVLGLSGAARNLASRDNFISLKGYIKDQLEKLGDKDFKTKCGDLDALGQLDFGDTLAKIINKSKIKLKDKNGSAQKLLDAINKIETEYKKSKTSSEKLENLQKSYISLARSVGGESIKTESTELSKDLIKLEKAAEARYPLVSTFFDFGEWYALKACELIVENLNQIDSIFTGEKK